MSNTEYEDLWHYSERFTRDSLQRSELVTMAWKEGQRLGERCTPGLMKSAMHFRAKELRMRSAFPVSEVGKRKADAFNHDLVYLDRPVRTVGEKTPLAEFLLPMRVTPLDFTIADDFMENLTDDERVFLDDLTAGYSMKEIRNRQGIDQTRVNALHTALREKAVSYL